MKRITTLAFSMALTTDYNFPYVHILFKQHYKTFGKNPENYEWINPVYITQDVDPAEVVNWILDQKIDIVFASMYLWNHQYTHLILKKVKAANPNIVIIVGGPHVFADKEEYWNEHPWIDLSVNAKVYGEAFVVDYLDGLPLEEVTGAIWRGGSSVKQFDIRDFEWAPRVYADNIEYVKWVIDEVARRDPKGLVGFAVETSRGCPFACVFCEWGGGIATKMNKKPMKDVMSDMAALVKAKAPKLHICDSNFGFWEEDLTLLKQFAAWNRVLKFPQVLTIYGWSKNNSKRHYEMCKAIANSTIDGFYYALSIQGLRDLTLKNIKRSDNPLEDRWALAKRIHDELGTKVYVEVLMALPGDKLNDYYNILNKRHELDAFSHYVWMLLPNTEAHNQEYREKYGIKTAWAHNVQPQFIKQRDQSINTELTEWYAKNKYEYVIGSYSLTPEEWLEVFILEKLYNTAKRHSNIWNQLEKQRLELELTPSQYWKRMMKIFKEVDNKEWNEIWIDLWPRIRRIIEPLEEHEVRFMGTAGIEDNNKKSIYELMEQFFKLNAETILSMEKETV